MGEKDERGKALFANLERGVGIFLQNSHLFPSYLSDINRTAYIARKKYREKKSTVKEVEINIKY